MNCEDGNNYLTEFKAGKACKFDYEKILADTNCTLKKNFGYESNKMCVMIKINKIYSWKPEFEGESKIKITCEGEVSKFQKHKNGSICF